MKATNKTYKNYALFIKLLTKQATLKHFTLNKRGKTQPNKYKRKEKQTL